MADPLLSYEFGLRAEAYRRRMSGADRLKFDQILEHGRAQLLNEHQARSAKQEDRVQAIKAHLWAEARLETKIPRPANVPPQPLLTPAVVDRRARAMEAGQFDRLIREIKRRTRGALEQHVERALGIKPKEQEKEKVR